MERIYLLSLDNSSFSKPLSSARFGGFYRTQRNSTFSDINYIREGLFLVIQVHSTCIGYLTDGCDPIYVLNKSRVFSVRACTSRLIYKFLFKYFIFFLSQNN